MPTELARREHAPASPIADGRNGDCEQSGDLVRGEEVGAGETQRRCLSGRTSGLVGHDPDSARPGEMLPARVPKGSIDDRELVADHDIREVELA